MAQTKVIVIWSDTISFCRLHILILIWSLLLYINPFIILTWIRLSKLFKWQIFIFSKIWYLPCVGAFIRNRTPFSGPTYRCYTCNSSRTFRWSDEIELIWINFLFCAEWSLPRFLRFYHLHSVLIIVKGSRFIWLQSSLCLTVASVGQSFSFSFHFSWMNSIIFRCLFPRNFFVLKWILAKLVILLFIFIQLSF